MSKPLGPSFFARSTLEVAPDLIGCVMQVGAVAGRIIEVEAYTDDPASHGYRRTSRSTIMHETFGCVYVYTIYGRNHCVNITTDAAHVGAILIRALEPLRGIGIMSRRRGTVVSSSLCSGPGKLCQALGIDLSFNWTQVGERVKIYAGRPNDLVVTTPRIGISKATDFPWRFVERNNPHASRGAVRAPVSMDDAEHSRRKKM